MTTMTNELDKSPANLAKCDRVERVLQRLLDQALRRGFHGIASIEVSVQDGTIQHFRHRLERLEK